MSNIEQLVLQAKTCFQAKDYETCMSLTDEALRVDRGNTEASWLMKEAQRQWEDQRSLEQLEIYVENLKKEAMDLFDKEHYEQCLGMFRFLSELEPENHTLRDYVRLSQQMFVETIGLGGPTANEEGASSSGSAFKKRSEALALGFRPPEADSQARLPAAVMPDLKVEPSESDSGPPTCGQGSSQNDQVQNDSLSHLLRDGGRRPGEGSATNGVMTLRGMRSPATARLPETGVPNAAVLDAEAIPQSVKQKIQEYLAATMPARQKRSLNVWLTSALFLVTTLAAGGFWLYSFFVVSHIEIQSTPEKAVVFIDNKRMGETPFRQQGIPAGSYALRIEKQGYQTHNRNLAVKRAQAIILVVQLEKAKAALSSTLQSTVPLEPQTQPPAPQPAVSDPVEMETTAAQIAQSVIHHHLLGSCTGRLKIDGDRISFWSSGNSQDAFTRKIKQITHFALGEKLLIEFKDKTYRFEALARDPKDNRQRLTPFYEQIKFQKTPPQKPL
jgi:PEGA domain